MISFTSFSRISGITLLYILSINFNLLAGDETERLRTLVIDPGHGGQDPGALGAKSKEKDIVLAVGLKLGQLINEKNNDVKVIFPRSSDVFIPLHERADIANRNKADLFISIHANANNNRTIFGSETYSMGLHTNEKNLEVAQKENAVITFEKDYSTHYEGYDPNSAESFIIFQLVQNTYMGQSLEFAGFVQNNFEKQAKRYNRGVRQAGFLVLWKTAMPSVLIEVGFVTNPTEEKYMLTEEGQLKLANAIYKAFSEYKIQIESKSVFTHENLKTNSNTEDTGTTLEIIDTTTVLYRVQILSSNKRVSRKSKEFSKCKKINGYKSIYEITGNSNYKYLIGSSENYDEISDFSKEVKKQYPEAFVVALKNGKIVNLNEVQRK
jgi:N-acetylmuramoyl-L-alanine amidase